MRRDEIVLQFFSDPPKGMQATPAMSGTLYFTPADVLGLAHEFRDVPFEWGPEVLDYGMREFAIRDPNGYLLAFTEAEPAQSERSPTMRCWRTLPVIVAVGLLANCGTGSLHRWKLSGLLRPPDASEIAAV